MWGAAARRRRCRSVTDRESTVRRRGVSAAAAASVFNQPGDSGPRGGGRGGSGAQCGHRVLRVATRFRVALSCTHPSRSPCSWPGSDSAAQRWAGVEYRMGRSRIPEYPSNGYSTPAHPRTSKVIPSHPSRHPSRWAFQLSTSSMGREARDPPGAGGRPPAPAPSRLAFRGAAIPRGRPTTRGRRLPPGGPVSQCCLERSSFLCFKL